MQGLSVRHNKTLVDVEGCYHNSTQRTVCTVHGLLTVATLLQKQVSSCRVTAEFSGF
jgi:hypothetical protein